MSHESPALEVCASRQVHPGLRLEVSLSLGRECGVVFGPSGAGKTSLLQMIAGLDRPDSGLIQVGGQTWFDSASRRNLPLRLRRVGMIFQDDLLFPHLNVRQNVRFGLKGFADADRRADEVARLCGVVHLLGRRPEALSGGERQRVGLARALAPRPRVLLCDEPVSALDLESRFALIAILRDVQAAENIPLLHVTHSPAEAVALGSRLFLLDGGRIVDEGPPLDVLSRRKGAIFERLDNVKNVHCGSIAGHEAGNGETFVSLSGGPTLIVPYLDRPLGSAVIVAVRADDVLLARGEILGLSARNRLAGTVDRILPHGGDAEVLVTTGTLTWIVSVVAPAVAALELQPGVEVQLIIKARSCHVL